MMKIKLYLILSIFAVLLISITTAGIAIKVAKYRGEQIDNLSRQLDELSTRTAKYETIMTQYMEDKNERQKIYQGLRNDLDSCTDDVYLPDSWDWMWERFTASQTCDSGSVNDSL